MSVGISQSTYRPPEQIRENKPASEWDQYGGDFLAFFFLLVVLAICVVAL